MTVQSFKHAVEKLQQQIGKLDESHERAAQDAQYLSDMNNWLLVHATNYMPKTNKNGARYILPTSAATDYKFVRNTIHTTMNHIVTSHGGGDWSGQPYIILMPYNDTVAKNGNPANVNMIDTFFSVAPDRGLVLPDTAHIVMADNDLPDGTLFETRGNTTVYKQMDFTPAEREQIIPFLKENDARDYQMLSQGRLDIRDTTNQVNVQQMIDRLDARGKKLYESARDKNAFVRGLLQADADAILGQYMRNLATSAAAEKMGYKILTHYNSSAAQTAFDNVVVKNNLCNGIHDASLQHTVEMSARRWRVIFSEPKFHDDPAIFTAKSLDELYDKITQNINEPEIGVAITALLTNQRPDFFPLLSSKALNAYNLNPWVKTPLKTIGDEDKNLEDSLRKYCAKKTLEFERWRQKLQSMPGYDAFIQKLAQVEPNIHSIAFNGSGRID